MTHADLTPLRHPSHIVLVGASERPGSLGAVATQNLLQHSNPRCAVSLVNRRRAIVFGRPTLGSIDELPDTPDVALVVVGRNDAVNAVADLADRGTAVAVMVSGGFAEADREGALLQAQLSTIVNSTGIRIVGPNSPGVGDFHVPLGLTIQPGFPDDLRAGGIGLVCQSGGLTRGVLQTMHRGVGFSAFFSPGNQVDLTLADYVEHLVHDEKTTTIAIVAEGIGDPERFEAALRLAAMREKPIVMLKVGRSEAGRDAAASHTGSMVGSSAAMLAVADRYGVHVVDDLDDLVMAAAWAERKPPEPAGVAVYGLSGGAGVLLTDALGDLGVRMATLGDDTVQGLDEVTAPGVTAANPVDVGGPGLSDPTAFERGLRLVVADQDVSTVLVTFNAWYANMTARFVDAVIACATGTSTPIIPVWMSPRGGPELERLETAGLIPAGSVRVAARLASKLQEKRTPNPAFTVHAPYSEPLRADWATWAPGETVTETHVKASLANVGVRVPAEEHVTTPAVALRAADRLGYPSILKAVGPTITHRVGTGLISGRIDDDNSLVQAWDAVSDAIADLAGPDVVERFLCQYVPEGLEAYVGMATDPEWGPIISFGLGGQLVEVLADTTVLMPDVDRTTLRETIASSRVGRAYRLLHPHGPGLEELLALLELVTSASRRPCALFELDLNPVILDLRGAWVVDGLAVRNARDVPSPPPRGSRT